MSEPSKEQQRELPSPRLAEEFAVEADALADRGPVSRMDPAEALDEEIERELEQLKPRLEAIRRERVAKAVEEALMEAGNELDPDSEAYQHAVSVINAAQGEVQAAAAASKIARQAPSARLALLLAAREMVSNRAP